MNYDDIINMKHPTSTNHPRMSMNNRAAQFAPFAAFKLGETARHIVFSVREASATTRLVSSGSSPLSRHSTDA